MRQFVFALLFVGVACTGAYQATVRLPLSVTHYLTPACGLERRPWLKSIRPLLVVGIDLSGALRLPPPPIRDTEVYTVTSACVASRGAFGDPHSINEIRERWPSQAELTALRQKGAHEDGGSLHER